LKPRLIRPPAISRTASAVWLPGPAAPDAELSSGASRRSVAALLTAFQNIAGMVSPGTTRSVRGWICARSQRLLMPAYLQVFFFFQRRSPRTPVSFMPR
jgi:hypothetical protein